MYTGRGTPKRLNQSQKDHFLEPMYFSGFRWHRNNEIMFRKIWQIVLSWRFQMLVTKDCANNVFGTPCVYVDANTSCWIILFLCFLSIYIFHPLFAAVGAIDLEKVLFVTLHPFISKASLFLLFPCLYPILSKALLFLVSWVSMLHRKHLRKLSSMLSGNFQVGGREKMQVCALSIHCE